MEERAYGGEEELERFVDEKWSVIQMHLDIKETKGDNVRVHAHAFFLRIFNFISLTGN